MQDPPSSSVIVELANAHSQTAERRKFEMRMTFAALELAQRAAALAGAGEARERERLAALLGETGELQHLTKRLCALIRDGVLTLSSPGVAAHLRATTMEKLAVDQPSYAAYRRALERSQE